MIETRKAFVWVSRAWYAGTVLTGDTVDEIDIGMYSPDDGCEYEFTLEWNDNGMQVRVFDDGFVAFSEFKEFFKSLSDSCRTDLTPEGTAALLSRLGYVDDTPTKSPYGSRACKSRELDAKDKGA
jgi:hypothetical protein